MFRRGRKAVGEGAAKGLVTGGVSNGLNENKLSWVESVDRVELADLRRWVGSLEQAEFVGRSSC